MAKFRTHNLSPDLPARFGAGEAETVGYVSGDLPYVLLHVRGQVLKLWRGQSVPVSGNSYALENVFARTGEVAIAVNIPVSLAAEQGKVDAADAYQSDVAIPVLADHKAGVAIMPTEGSVILIVNATRAVDVILYPDARSAYMDVRPAGFMDAAAPTFTSSLGNTLTNIASIAGHYTDALAADWVAASEYLGNPVKLQSNKNGTFEVRKGSALFVVSADLDEDISLALKLQDLGSYRGKGIV